LLLVVVIVAIIVKEDFTADTKAYQLQIEKSLLFKLLLPYMQHDDDYDDDDGRGRFNVSSPPIGGG